MVFAFLGTQEIIIILVIALLVFGPQKLPEIGKQVGSALRELNRMRSDVQRAFDLDEFTPHYDHTAAHYDSAPYGTTYPSSSEPPALEGAEHSVPVVEADHEAYVSHNTDPYHGSVTGDTGYMDGGTTTSPYSHESAAVVTSANAFVPPPGPLAGRPSVLNENNENNGTVAADHVPASETH